MSRCRLFASMMAADYCCLQAELEAVVEAGVDGLHFDVMDGNFVPNITFGRDLIAAMRPLTDVPFDVHLMVNDPDLLLQQVIEAGASRVAVHPEVGGMLQQRLARIRELGAQPGVAISPSVPLEMVEWVLDDVDYVIAMSVNPGFSGQQFIPSSKRKLKALSELIRSSGRRVRITVDGGVEAHNIAELAALGGDDFIAGGSIFYNRPAEDRQKVAADRVRQLRQACPKRSRKAPR
ncbi:MAG: ribulose-phosphate 3-epimerase [Armatimonadota bacterium]